ncbi:ABC transporter ATP-binding protein [Tepidimicrobium xylanilyticum]|uniref:Iron complex transport system ATP-binding protein n=1 Tax=Tepidimicrobium xylanilyticum TaxID=1123352 RepID=A0A1H2ZI42_9FIRM|nr:ABC transporter ATP-binding protein [Tepidimicrobium xylanilyticum]GMG96496.1 iron ABC transporter ATP-binding protein [Tepidimicrobium xylanilyticum]SDX17076.1 iron complex transport system ATP-binding protein [Tepidimicrobium xylanilyticum]
MVEAKKLKIAYEERVVIDDFSFHIKKGEMVSIIGPNGSGKSTILKTISKLIKQKEGVIFLDKEDMNTISIKNLAKKMSSLSQHNRNPEDITVRELIYYGRLPHKKWYERRTKEDDEIMKWAITHTSLQGYEDKRVSELSGGERQRVWIAMALTQRSKILLLDEPTTYLDICHQLEVMELVKELNKRLELTVIMVLHDLSQAAKYSDRLLVIKEGKLVAEGKPFEILTEDLIRYVYNVEVCVCKDLLNGEIIIHPIGVCKSFRKRCKYEAV